MMTYDEILKAENGKDMAKVIEVADTAYIALAWLAQYCPDSYTVSDVLTLTQMIIQKERQNVFDEPK